MESKDWIGKSIEKIPSGLRYKFIIGISDLKLEPRIFEIFTQLLYSQCSGHF